MFARRIYTPPPAPHARPVTRRFTYATDDQIVAAPKHDYIRSPALLAAVRTLPCQHTDVPGQTEAAHSNWGWGKGRGIKCDDNRVAALCRSVHRELDQGSRWSEARRQVVWWHAHVRTVHALILDGLWPAGVPVPDTHNCPFWDVE